MRWMSRTIFPFVKKDFFQLSVLIRAQIWDFAPIEIRTCSLDTHRQVACTWGVWLCAHWNCGWDESHGLSTRDSCFPNSSQVWVQIRFSWRPACEILGRPGGWVSCRPFQIFCRPVLQVFLAQNFGHCLGNFSCVARDCFSKEICNCSPSLNRNKISQNFCCFLLVQLHLQNFWGCLLLTAGRLNLETVVWGHFGCKSSCVTSDWLANEIWNCYIFCFVSIFHRIVKCKLRSTT